jgi:putative FmdB family regulatory protein
LSPRFDPLPKMPLYDLQCQSCQHVWEVQIRMADPLPACPECQGTTVEKVITTAAHSVHTPYVPSKGETITFPRRKEYGKR